MATIRQTNFGAGELSPSFATRPDVDKYAAGLARCRNFFLNLAGKPVSRAGTQYCGSTKDDAAVRLIPFVFSETDAVLLEVGHLYIRFWVQGVPQGAPYEVPSPWTSVEIGRLKYAQSGNVITFAHPGHPPQELRRLRPGFFTDVGGIAWSLVPLTFDGVPFPTSGFLLTPRLQASNTLSGEVKYTGDGAAQDFPVPFRFALDTDLVVLNTHLGTTTQQVLGAHYTVTGAGTGSAGNVHFLIAPATGDTVAISHVGHPAREWEWWISIRIKSASGLVTETLPWKITQDDTGASLPAKVYVGPDAPVTVEWVTSPFTSLSGYGIQSVIIYRGRGKVRGYVGEVDTGAPTFTDAGNEPDYTRPPLSGTNPFKVYDYLGALVGGLPENPSVVTFFEQRRVFANTPQRPSRIWASRIGDWANFDSTFPSTEDGEVEFELASRRNEEVRSLLGLDKLLGLTSANAWAMGGSNGPLAPTSIEARVQAEFGASWLDPIVVGDVVLFVKAKGAGVREMAFQLQRGKFITSDIGLLSQHLFEGHAIGDWTYAADPHSLVWAVRDDGVLLSLTYSPEQQLASWAWHDTDGAVEAVCALPEGTESRLYLVVRRTVAGATVRYVERMESRLVPDVALSPCLDAFKLYTGAGITTLTGLEHLNGKAVTVLADGNVEGPHTVVAGSITLDNPADTVVVGLPFTPELQTLPPSMQGKELHSLQKTVREVSFEVEASRGLQVGADFDSLLEWKEREVAHSYDAIPLETKEGRVRIKDGWHRGGQVVLRQAYPLPLTVLSITREVDFGGV